MYLITGTNETLQQGPPQSGQVRASVSLDESWGNNTASFFEQGNPHKPANHSLKENEQ